jgi:hypothetical protein
MTSRHGSEGGRRGIATWIPVTIVIVVLVAAATTAYLLIVNGSDDKAACDTQVTLPIVAAPGAAQALTAAVAAFDSTAPVARSACVTTTVTEMSGSAATTGLLNSWSGQASPPPAVWVPASAADLAELENADSALTAGRDQAPIASSPVVIAVRSAEADALTGLSWQDLSAATGPDGSVTLPSGQHLVLALPNPTINRATSYALQSVVAAGAGGSVDPAAVAAAAPALQKIGAGGPNPPPTTTLEALTQLAAGNSDFTAVPVVASDLAEFSASTPGLIGISPSGATVGDEVYPVPLSAGWVSPTLDDAAALFLAYLRGPDGTVAFTENGLSVADSTTPSSLPTAASSATSAPTTAASGTSSTTSLPDAGPQVASALAAAIGSVPGG